ncbi:hypothetical protein ACFQAT_24690 [Undibacterium arcticum]|uniref:Uncharacterized protein n=1 Tax=Undibacterium arcticum TaxID=1762892 RepID=A0ABV7F4T7_9BURK
MRNGVGFGKTLRIGVSRTSLTLLQSSGWLRRRDSVVSDLQLTTEETASSDQIAAHLDAMLTDGKCRDQAVTVILADDLVRYFMVTPPRNVKRLQDCRSAAAMRFQSLYGEPAVDWQMEADWALQKPFLSCALPHSLLSVLQQAADKHQLKLIAVLPQFVAAWNQWRSVIKPDAWFGVAHADSLTVAAIDRQGLRAVRTTALASEHRQDEHWLPAHVKREALRLNLAQPSRIQLCGVLAAHWSAHTASSPPCERLDLHTVAPHPAHSAGVALTRTGIRT